MPRSWSIKRLLRIHTKSKTEEKKETMKPDETYQPTEVISPKKKKKETGEEKPELTWSKLNGSTKITATLFPDSAESPSADSWTSSTDYSPSSRSYTISTASGSIENENLSQLPAKNKDQQIGSPLSNTSGLRNGHNTLNDKRDQHENDYPPSARLDGSQSAINDCSNIGDYVENALLSTSLTSFLSRDSLKGTEEAHPTTQLSLSYQSQSSLNNTNKEADSSPVITSAFKLDMVSLDYIKSAAVREKTTGSDDPADSSSLSSSFMSSVDSEDGSTIGSDVVENLCNKIAAATAKYKLKNSAPNDMVNDSNSKSFPGVQSLLSSQPSLNGRFDEEASDGMTELDFSNCNLKQVPEEINLHASSLLKLSLESNAIVDLTKELFACQKLRELRVGDNDIASLPPTLAGLTNLIHLDVSKNVIEDIPECMPCLKNLVVLDASVNPIEKLSEGFTQLVSLQELYMNDCFFDFLPASLGRMSELRVLELRDNQLQILPKSMRRLANLVRLDLGGNVLQDWPDVISKLSELRELWLDCNELNEVPSDIGNLSQLTYLDLSRNFLNAVPNQVGYLVHLTDLLLAENNLTSLPDTIGFLKQLTVLNIEHNKIEKLPDSFGKLEDLEELDISHNKLTELPPAIGKQKKLRMLLADDNQMKKIPEQLGNCSSLSILQLSRNQIESLPETIGQLKKLRVLNICQNRVPYLPITVNSLPMLEALWVSPNQSKPRVPMQVEKHPQSKMPVLTNVLFPQELNGLSRASKVLGAYKDDDDVYAIDAADDIDLDAYSCRKRGKTQVTFDLKAITYSDVIFTSPQPESQEQTEELIESKKSFSITRQAGVDDFAIEIPSQQEATGLFVPLSSHTSEQFESEKSFESISKKILFSDVSSPVDAENDKVDPTPLETSIGLSSGKENLSLQSVCFYQGTVRSKSESCESEKEDDSYTSSFLNPDGSNLPDLDPKNLKEHIKNDDNPPAPRKKCHQSSTQSFRDKVDSINNGFNQPYPDVMLSKYEKQKPEIPQKPASLHSKELHASLNQKVAKQAEEQCNSFFESADKQQSRVIEQDRETKADLIGPAEPDTKCSAATILMKTVDLEQRQVVSLSKVSSESDQSASYKSEFSFGKDKNFPPPPEDMLLEIEKNPDVNVVSHPVAGEKPSSVSSADSIPATDDSGVGINDAEPHEVAEEFDQVNSPKICWKSTPTTKHEMNAFHQTSDTKMQHITAQKAASRAHSTSDEARHENQLSVEGADKKNFNVELPKSVSAQAPIDHVIHEPRKPPVPPPPIAKKNKVAANIKKFEKSIEKETSGPIRSNSSRKNSNLFKNWNTSTTNSKPTTTIHSSFDSISTTTKPMAIATIVNTTANHVANNAAGCSRVENVRITEEMNYNNVLKSLDLYTKAKESHKRRESGCTELSLDDSNVKNGAMSDEKPPISARKSKFDEALAATKHKHFREKLEKVMQQQRQTSVSDSLRRLSRGSASSIASIPRITSPVPQHRGTTLERMTAENTADVHTEQFPRSNSAVLTLQVKDRLHSRPDNNHLTSGTVTHSSTIGRRSSESKQQLWIRDGDKSHHDVSDRNNLTLKMSLEEQLGKLCIDGASAQQLQKGFAPYLPDEFSRSTSTRSSKRSSTSPKDASQSSSSSSSTPRRPSRPSDWRNQLLEYLDRKKSQTELSQEKIAPRKDSTALRAKLYRTDLPNSPLTQSLADEIPGSIGNPATSPPNSSHYLSDKSHSSIKTRRVPENGSQNSSLTAAEMLRDNTRSSTLFFSSKLPGRRAPGKYQRTRTPGPEMISSEPKVTDLAIRPKSAMDRPFASTEFFDFYSEVPVTKKPEVPARAKPVVPVSIPAPPSYEDHVMRYVQSSKEENQNYVNLDYFYNRMRASMQEKRQENKGNQMVSPRRMTQPNTDVGHVTKPSSNQNRDTNMLQRENATTSKLENSYFHNSSYPHSHFSNSNNHLRDSQHPSQVFHHPAPYYHPQLPYQSLMVNENIPNLDQPLHYQHLYSARYVPGRPVTPTSAQRHFLADRIMTEQPVFDDPYISYNNRFAQPRHHQQQEFLRKPNVNNHYNDVYNVQPRVQQQYVSKDESASAFRPYQQPFIPSQRNQSYNSPSALYRPGPSYHEDDGRFFNHQPLQQDPAMYKRPMDALDGKQRAPTYSLHPPIHFEEPIMHRKEHHSAFNADFYSEKSSQSSFEPLHHTYDRMEVGVKLVTVSVRKDPNFGFHIMGGIDSGGNPYRTDDDGVFITYVTPGGAADGKVQQGDKILMVNGSEFVGISHKRAVDLLQNAGNVAVLVVERVVGRQV